MSLSGNTHLIAGGADAIDAVIDLLKSEGFDTGANPDLYVRSYAHFGIDEARELRERAQLSALGDRRAFVIFAPHMTTDAQNALLKTLEEPPVDAFFFIIVPAPETLLSTLRSRMQRLVLPSSGGSSNIGKDFLAAVPAKRLDMIKSLLGKDEDDNRDLAGIITFLSSLERMLEKRAHESAASRGLEAIYRARRYLNDKGALLKPLLEQVALLVPVMKA